jgi:hypothetical protein
MEMVFKQGEKMTEEDEEFNRIEREAKQRLEAVKDTIRYRDAFPKDYRLPKPWVWLTDEEIVAAIYEAEGFNYGLDNGNVSDKAVIEYVRIVEAKLKEKNEM